MPTKHAPLQRKQTKPQPKKAPLKQPKQPKVLTPPKAAALIAVRRSRIQGRGVFATGLIRKGARIIEYTGERITDDEANARYDDAAMQRHHTFLFQVGGDIVIDGARKGNDSRFINHSCDPNCETAVIGKRVFIEARRRIAAGEELAYDYWYQRDGTEDDDAEAQYACRCGTARCRGSILAPLRKKRKKSIERKKA